MDLEGRGIGLHPPRPPPTPPKWHFGPSEGCLGPSDTVLGPLRDPFLCQEALPEVLQQPFRMLPYKPYRLDSPPSRALDPDPRSRREVARTCIQIWALSPPEVGTTFELSEWLVLPGNGLPSSTQV